VFKYLGFLSLILSFVVPLRAQNEPIKMTPELAFTFPVTKVGHDVTVKYSVLINPSTVITPGMILRVLYLPPIPTQDSSDLVLAHKGNMEKSFSRDTLNPDEQSKMPPELAHALEGFRRTVWEAPINFQLALAQFPTDDMHLIYSPKGTSQDLSDQKFSFFDGLFIGLPEGKVTVLAVEKKSRTDEAGIKASDEIVAVGGIPIPNDLDAFASAYATAKKTAKESNATTFSLTVRSPDKPETHTLNVAMPPTIKSSLMDGF